MSIILWNKVYSVWQILFTDVYSVWEGCICFTTVSSVHMPIWKDSLCIFFGGIRACRIDISLVVYLRSCSCVKPSAGCSIRSPKRESFFLYAEMNTYELWGSLGWGNRLEYEVGPPPAKYELHDRQLNSYSETLETGTPVPVDSVGSAPPSSTLGLALLTSFLIRLTASSPEYFDIFAGKFKWGRQLLDLVKRFSSSIELLKWALPTPQRGDLWVF